MKEYKYFIYIYIYIYKSIHQNSKTVNLVEELFVPVLVLILEVSAAWECPLTQRKTPAVSAPPACLHRPSEPDRPV